MADAQVTIKVSPREWMLLVEGLRQGENWWLEAARQDRADKNFKGAKEADQQAAAMRDLMERISR